MSKVEPPKSATAAYKILVMDDEESVLNLIGRVLSSAGYNVILVSEGQQAVEAYAAALSSNQPVAAVILDLNVPSGMGGKETLEKLLVLDPDVRAIVSSGYTADPILASYKEYGFMGVLLKPYTVEELLEVVGSVLADVQ